jgi:hypothetical protein
VAVKELAKSDDESATQTFQKEVGLYKPDAASFHSLCSATTGFTSNPR